MTTQVNVLNTQALKPFPHTLASSSADGTNAVPLLHSPLDGVAVAHVHPAQQSPVFRDQHLTVGHHAVDIKNKGMYVPKYLELVHRLWVFRLPLESLQM